MRRTVHRGVAWACGIAFGAGSLLTMAVADGAERPAAVQWADYERTDPPAPARTVFPSSEFKFCRIQYTSYGEHPKYNRRGRWTIDYPESDVHFSWRLSQLTTIKVARTTTGEYEHAVVTLTDPALYDYPFVYLIEPGALVFTDEEAAALRDYLLRGGFLMVDDFWGEEEWENWVAEFARVLDPIEYPMVELPITHPIFNCVFELTEKPQVPSAWFWMTSGKQTSERGRESAITKFRGVFDSQGRLMAVICHNTDIGDGWEREGENEAYFHEVSAKKAYPMGINIVVYALTH